MVEICFVHTHVQRVGHSAFKVYDTLIEKIVSNTIESHIVAAVVCSTSAVIAANMGSIFPAIPFFAARFLGKQLAATPSLRFLLKPFF